MEFATGGRLEVRITTADVGKRVSVRSLTGPGDRDATFTDTVGVLTSWSNGVLKITRRDGRSVTLDEAALVAGRTVPPAPARRRGLPAADAHELQWVAARGWPAIETEALGGWTLRASGGFTARANSVLPLGDPGMDPESALERVTHWYAARGLPAILQFPTGSGAGDAGLGSALDSRLGSALDGRGWTTERHTLVRTGALAPLADRPPDARVLLRREPDAAWLRAYHRVDQPDATVRAVLTGGPSVWFATVPGEGEGERGGEGGGREPEPAAIGRCVVDGRWAGFAAVEVAPEGRRQGLATAVMAELARAALDEGASAAYLQVEEENAAARALYDGLGFADHHRYHYRREPGHTRSGSQH